MSSPLVLASTSSYRKLLLGRLGLPFQVAEPTCDEAPSGQPLPDLPAHLALAKALSVRAAHPDAFILGADQLVIVDGEAVGKPGDRASASAQLHRLAGSTHSLITAVALSRPDGRAEVRVSTFAMTMRPLRDDEISRYLDADEPLDCCGSYKIEARGISLFSAVLGDDVTAIEGLPLIAVSELLRSAGFLVP